MSSMDGFFVRKVTDDAISAVQNMFPSAELRTNSEFIRVLLGTDAPEQALMELSSRLETDVMWLSYQSVVDAFEYYHWQAGTLLRALVYGQIEERIWERIEGQAEAWEQAMFFDPEDLASMLEEDEDDEEKFTDEEKQELAQFWQNGELMTGRNEPILGAQRCAFHIATYYRFPGWDV